MKMKATIGREACSKVRQIDTFNEQLKFMLTLSALVGHIYVCVCVCVCVYVCMYV